MKTHALILLILATSPSPALTLPAAEPLENLSLEQAIALAERQHPQLAEARALVDAAVGRAQQAGAFPDPEVILGAQQLPLDNDASNQREYVAGIAQPIPLGTRLRRAREVEFLEREVRSRGLEVAHRDLRRRVHSAFATALYQDSAFHTQSRIHEGAMRAVATTQALVEAGDAVPNELARVEMELARTNVELQRTSTLREQSFIALAAAIGDAHLYVKSLAGDLSATFEIPTLEALSARLSEQPEIQLADAQVRASHAQVELARAQPIPDVKVEVLYHRLDATRENTLDIGLSIPLPLFNRNQGRIREARAVAAASQARARATQTELLLQLRQSHAQLAGALAARRTLELEILPRADSVLKVAEARHHAGDISLSGVLPVRRDWAVMQLTYLESLRDVMLAWAELSGYLSSL